MPRSFSNDFELSVWKENKTRPMDTTNSRGDKGDDATVISTAGALVVVTV